MCAQSLSTPAGSTVLKSNPWSVSQTSLAAVSAPCKHIAVWGQATDQQSTHAAICMARKSSTVAGLSNMPPQPYTSFNQIASPPEH